MRASGRPPVNTLPIGDARRARRAQLIVDPPLVQLASVADDRVPGPCGGTPLRRYRPSTDKGFPVALYFHGGGWTVDDLDTHDHLCRRLARRSGAVVVSVDYRQGPPTATQPPSKTPTPQYDGSRPSPQSAGSMPSRMAVAGDSAGGNLATAAALLCRDRRGPALRFQALAYPVTDHWQTGTTSYRQLANGYTLTRAFMKWSFEQHLPAGVDSIDRSSLDSADPFLLPLRAPDLTDLPPALILTVEFDPLRDEGRAYAQALKTAGVAVEHIHFEDQMHGLLLQEPMIDRAREAVDRFADALRRALA
jgi:acetyl esterase